jgi:peptide/nickel transport system permease protein
VNGKLWAGSAIALLLLLVALAGPRLAPHDPNRQDLASVRQPPVWAGGAWRHPLGTDSLGRDILSRLLWGARVAVVVAVASAAISALVGVPVALVAGYARGRVDTVLMRVVDVWMSIPAVLLAIVLMAVLGLGLWKVVLAIVIVDWTRFARVIRGEVLALREKEFVEAAVAQGASNRRLIFSEILPNVITVVIVLMPLMIATTILTEAALSFLGVGVQPPGASWGTIISDGQNLLYTRPWVAIAPGIMIVLTVLALNVLGDGIRDALDPRAKLRVEG